MPLHPPGNRRERLLVYGFSGSGKSTTYLQVARWIKKTGGSSKVFLIDTDNSWEAYRPIDGSLDSIVVPFDVVDYGDWQKAESAIYSQLNRGRNDWLAVDMIDDLWVFAQEDYTDQVYGVELDEFWIGARKAAGSEGMMGEVGGAYGQNWGIINKRYNARFAKIMRFPGHVVACTPEADVREPNKSGKGGDADEIRNLFGRIGKRPQGQKDLPFGFHTILYLQETAKGWRMTAVKDRERERVKGTDNGDFVMSYLIKVAGWKP